jgi:hypothetical protein
MLYLAVIHQRDQLIECLQFEANHVNDVWSYLLALDEPHDNPIIYNIISSYKDLYYEQYQHNPTATNILVDLIHMTGYHMSIMPLNTTQSINVCGHYVEPQVQPQIQEKVKIIPKIALKLKPRMNI